MAEGARGADVAPGLTVVLMQPTDWPAVARIYADGIATGNATLEGEAPTWEAFDRGHRTDCRLVARLDGEVVGWVALTRYSRRDAYTGVAWESVYVAEGVRGRGVGQRLLMELVRESERAGIWTLIAGVMAENDASLALHAKAGFRRIGVQRRIGRDSAGRWRDVVLLERRSAAVGL
jgi:phosphinothricin acetyltransferase